MDNLGYLTDHFFLEENYEYIIDNINAYSIICSPNQPSFFYGNYLFLHDELPPDSRTKWESIFDQYFSNDERIRHYTFCWSGGMNHEYEDFVNSGYEKEELVVLRLEKGSLIDKSKTELLGETRMFNTVSDWEQWTELNVTDENPGSNEASYRIYLKGRKDTYQKLINKGYGNIYGIFIDGQLAASAGLFYKNGVGRFQNVITDKAFRRRGFCSSLISSLSNDGFKHVEELVIVADKHYHALGLYEALGYKPYQYQSSLCKRRKQGEG